MSQDESQVSPVPPRLGAMTANNREAESQLQSEILSESTTPAEHSDSSHLQDLTPIGSRANPIDLTGGDMNTGITPTTFTVFSDLPAELRRMIWRLALPGPRLVEIRATQRINDWNWWPVCSENVPELFFATQEVRAVVCETYKPFQGTKPNSPVVFANFAEDYMCIAAERFQTWGNVFFGSLSREFRGSIRRLVVSVLILEDFEKSRGDGGFKFTELALDEFATVHTSCKLPPRGKIIGLRDSEVESLYWAQLEEELFTRWKTECPGWVQPPSRTVHYECSERLEIPVRHMMRASNSSILIASPMSFVLDDEHADNWLPWPLI